MSQFQRTNTPLRFVFRKPQAWHLNNCHKAQHEGEDDCIGSPTENPAPQRKVDDAKAFEGDASDKPSRSEARPIGDEIYCFTRGIVTIKKMAYPELTQRLVGKMQENEKDI